MHRARPANERDCRDRGAPSGMKRQNVLGTASINIPSPEAPRPPSAVVARTAAAALSVREAQP